MNRTLAAGVAALALCVCASRVAAAEQSPTAAELHAAECIAALEAQAEALAAKVRAGQQELRPQLMTQLEYGAAFIGTAYLRGERDESRSQALLGAARERQGELSARDLRARQAQCAGEASRLLAESSALGRAVVSKVAKRHMAKLLER